MIRMTRISKKYYLRQIMACWLVCYMLLGIPAQIAMATPSGGTFQGTDTGTIVDGVVGGNNTVLVNQMESVIHWDSLNTSNTESLTFNHGGLIDAAVLNRVVGEGATIKTQFDGTLNGVDMRIFMINPAGIVFGSDAVINVSQLVASSLNIADEDFRNGLPYTFTGGVDAKAVEFRGSTTDIVENIALIGKIVSNTGALDAENYVVLAAGETVLITESGSSVAVEVSMPVQTPGCYDYRASNADDGSIDAQHVILAAGDVWATAYISAYDEASSDAVATIDIDAEGNVTVTDEVRAEAVGDGVDNATATITVDAGGDVTVSDDDDDGPAVLIADAHNGTQNTASISVSAEGNVEVTATDHGEALIIAEAYTGQNNDADVQINADGNVKLQEDASFTAWAVAKVEAGAYEGQNNTANVTVDTLGDLDIIANHGAAEIRTKAQCAENNTAKTEIIADGDVTVKADSTTGKTSTAMIESVAEDGINNSAETVIDALGDVLVMATAGGNAYAVSKAVIAAVTMEGQINKSNITIDADGDLKVTAIDSRGDEKGAMISARATNEYLLGHEDVLDGLVNTAKVDISARSAEIKGDNGTAFIEAVARNEIQISWGDTDVTEVTLKNIKNDADIVITTAADDDGDIENCGPAADNGDVLAIDIGGGGGGIDTEAFNVIRYNDYYDVDLTVQGPIENTADILINAGDDVMAISEGVMDFDNGDTEIDSEAWNDVVGDGAWYINLIEEGPVVNSSGVDITAGDDVKVMTDHGWAAVGAHSWNYSQAPLPDIFPDTKNNTATVKIDAGGDVKVLAINGDAEIGAGTEFASNNTATVTIDTVGGDVKVIDIGQGGVDTAKIEARAEQATNSNTAEVTINATPVVITYLDESDRLTTEIEGGDVKVIAKEGGNAEIAAFASGAYSMNRDSETDETSNTANVKINATAITALDGEEVLTGGGDVKVIAKDCDSDAEIEAIAINAGTNTADVLICIDGGVKVKGDRGGEAEIEAIAKAGYTNTASVGIGAKGDDGIEVIADRGGDAGISSKAKDGETNTASTIVCTGGGVDVLAQRGGDAEILAQAKQGQITDAYVGIGAMGDVVVQAGQMDTVGCDALIRAEAESMGCPNPESTADAEAVVVSHEGSVKVLAYNHGHSGIEAEAQGGHKNTAEVGVAAATDLSPSDVAIPDYPNGDKLFLSINNFYSMPLTGNVIVEAFGDSEAQILAWAHDATSIYEYPDTTVTLMEPTIVPGENTAQTVVCAPGEVLVATYEGGEARIKSRAGWFGEENAINKATTRVYASDVTVNTSARRGQGIWAWANSDNSDNPHVPGNTDMWEDYLVDYDGSYYCMDEHGEIAWTDGDAVLYIQDYGKRVDCPDCPPCPCEEEGFFAPVAPLAQFEIPRIEGCPGLTQAAALELGITGETLQVAIGNALALNPNIQPCQACATLVNAASILRDMDGSRMAAMVQVFNTLAPADALFTPEMAASIATAFGTAEEGSLYASVAEYIDAFVQYAAVLDTDLGSPTGDSVTFVMEKYGEGITGSDNGNIAAFVATRLEGIGG